MVGRMQLASVAGYKSKSVEVFIVMLQTTTNILDLILRFRASRNIIYCLLSKPYFNGLRINDMQS
jgi:hypothetical protein